MSPGQGVLLLSTLPSGEQECRAVGTACSCHWVQNPQVLCSQGVFNPKDRDEAVLGRNPRTFATLWPRVFGPSIFLFVINFRCTQVCLWDIYLSARPEKCPLASSIWVNLHEDSAMSPGHMDTLAMGNKEKETSNA